jgi:hypothetical protein
LIGTGCPDEEVAHDLARPRDLAQARAAPARVREREIEQLEGAIECGVEATQIAFLPGPDRAADIGSCICELLGQRERPPTPACQAGVHAGRRRSLVHESSVLARASRVHRRVVTPLTPSRGGAKMEQSGSSGPQK